MLLIRRQLKQKLSSFQKKLYLLYNPFYLAGYLGKKRLTKHLTSQG